MSDYSISAIGSNAGITDYEVVVTVEKVGSGSIDNPRLHIALTETDIPEFWGGLSEVNFVERLMLPNQNGTTLDFSSSSIEENTFSFSLDQSWVNANCAIVVFVQNNSTKEILQGAEFSLADFPTTNTLDAALLNASAPNAVCLNGFTPSIEVANFGLDNLTSLEINYEVNGGTPMTYNWTGDLAFLETAMVELSEITFDIQTNNTLSVSCQNPNGSDDQYPSNNEVSVSFIEALQVEPAITLILMLDDNPEETSWELVDSQNNVLYSGGDYTSSGPVFENFNLTETDCYSFKVYDEGGDGLENPGYKLYDGSVYFATGTDFGYEDETQFSIDVTGIAEDFISDEFSIFPNPIVNTASVSFVMETPNVVSLKVYDMMGRVVLQTEPQVYAAGNQSVIFNRENIESGIYFFSLEAGRTQFTQKVIIK